MQPRIRFTDDDVRNAGITSGPNRTGLLINDIRAFLVQSGQREMVGCLGANPTSVKWAQVPKGALPVLLTVKPWFQVLGKPKYGNDVAIVARDEKELVNLRNAIGPRRIWLWWRLPKKHQVSIYFVPEVELMKVCPGLKMFLATHGEERRGEGSRNRPAQVSRERPHRHTRKLQRR